MQFTDVPQTSTFLDDLDDFNFLVRLCLSRLGIEIIPKYDLGFDF